MDERAAIKEKVASVIAGSNCYPFLFIGSGLSMRYMHTRTWAGLLEWVCTEVLDDEFAYARVLAEANNAHRNKVIDSVMPYIATLIEDEADRILLSDAKFDWFRKRYMRELKEGVSPMKQFIADDLSKATVDECNEVEILTKRCAQKISGVITTNYDHLAEWLFPQSDVFVGGDDLLFRDMSYSAEIYKIHGSSSAPDTMVLDQADYIEFREKQAYLAAKILTVFVEYPIIFLGYSLQDPDMGAILESIARCAGPKNVGALANRFIFVEFGDANGEPVQTVERVFGSESIGMTRIVTRDFMPVYEALAEAETRYDPRVVRKLRQSLYAIASHLDPASTVVTSGFSKLDNLSENDRVIIGFNALGDGFGKIPTAEDLYYDAVFDDHDLNVDLVVNDYLPKLLRNNPGGLPMHKYVRDLNVSILDQRIINHLENRKSVDNFLNDSIRRSMPGWRAHLTSFTMSGLVDAFGFDDAHTKLAALNPDEIDIDELGTHLKQVIARGGGKEILRNNPELKRAIRIYDFLKYRS